MLNIALFSDLHGRIFLCFKLVERLQRERGIKIDLILQCGDMGMFPNINKLDKATMKHAQNDPTELGFSEYFMKPHSYTEKVLSKVDCPLICVRGNHEDHDFLDKLEGASTDSRFSADYYKKIWVCKTGYLQTFEKEEAKLNFVGIGRIGLPHDKKSEDKKFIQNYEREAIQKLNKDKIVKNEGIDILITHDAVKNYEGFGLGLLEINDFLDYHKPLYHFFGHIGVEDRYDLYENNFTHSYKPGELAFQTDGSLPKNCIILLRWENIYENTVEFINDPWLKEYHRSTWEYM